MMNKQTINTGKKSMTHRQAPAAWLGGCLLSLGLAWAPPTLAAEVTCGAAPDIEGAGMNCFNPNTAAKSGEVNANFKHLLDEIATLKARLAEVEDKLSAVSYDNNQKKLLIEGVNVQIVNGAGTTDTANSTGNLIIGYNKATNSRICTSTPNTVVLSQVLAMLLTESGPASAVDIRIQPTERVPASAVERGTKPLETMPASAVDIRTQPMERVPALVVEVAT